MTLLVNGQRETQLPAARRALDYGDGLFETMRYENGQVSLWTYHLARLVEGAERLAIDQSSIQIVDEMQQMLDHLHSQSLTEGVIKLRLIRGGDQRGYAPQVQVEHWRIFEFFEFLPEWGEAETAILCTQKTGLQKQLAGLKHLNRLEQVMAAKEVSESQASTGIMLDHQDSLCCAIDSNLYIEIEGKIVTPALEQSGVRGVFRSYAFDQLEKMGISVVAEDVDISLLSGCSGLWLSNAVKGLRPVQSVAGIASWPNPESPILKSLQENTRQALQIGSGSR